MLRKQKGLNEDIPISVEREGGLRFNVMWEKCGVMKERGEL
jgi:hypothetical protein